MLPAIFIAGGIIGQRYGAEQLVLVGLVLMAAGVGALMGTSSLRIGLPAARLSRPWRSSLQVGHSGLALGLFLFTPLVMSYSWNMVMRTAAMMALEILCATSKKCPAQGRA